MQSGVAVVCTANERGPGMREESEFIVRLLKPVLEVNGNRRWQGHCDHRDSGEEEEQVEKRH